MPMTQDERVAADVQVRRALGVNRKGTSPGAPMMPPRPGSALAVTAASTLPIDNEVYAIQLFGYGEIWGRAGLGLRERSFLTLGLLVGTCQQDQLGIHVNNALNLGLTPEEISEVVLHVGAYSGLSTWHNGNNIVRFVFIERGILEPGAGARWVASTPTNRDQRRAATDRVQRALGEGRLGLEADAPILTPRPGGAVAGGSLPVEADLREVQQEYVYGEIWSRPALDFRTRSMITVAVLQALRLSDQLHAHVNIALNLGVTADELHELFAHASLYSGSAGWNNAINVARDVFHQRGILPA